ncbi:MAG TPA: acyl-CoA dehydrogenase family protein [Chloroflexota bacterium]|jgi:alkylation response protein AidB-like acyl-CoA dehydrogenase
MQVSYAGPITLDLHAHAVAAADVFATRALDTERLGRLLNENVAYLVEMGVPRLLVPRQWHGSELDFASVIDLVITLARGCMSTAWCAALYAEHPWILAHFDERAQADVWGETANVPVCMSVAAFGRGAPVAGGLELSGSWPFVSGCDHAPWFLLSTQWNLAEGDAAGAHSGLCLVPREDVSIDQESWHVAGLRGTGSKTLRVDGAFVPEHRVRDSTALVTPPTFHRQTTGPLFCQPFGGTLGLVLAAVAVGGAEGALEHFRRRASERVLRHQNRVQAADPAAHLDLSEAAMRIQSAGLLLRDATEVVRLAGERSSELSVETLAELRARKAFIVRLATEAVDRLFAASGGGALQESNSLQRFWRDVHAIHAHAGMNWSSHAQNYGSVLAGLGPTINRPW